MPQGGQGVEGVHHESPDAGSAGAARERSPGRSRTKPATATYRDVVQRRGEAAIVAVIRANQVMSVGRSRGPRDPVTATRSSQATLRQKC